VASVTREPARRCSQQWMLIHVPCNWKWSLGAERKAEHRMRGTWICPQGLLTKSGFHTHGSPRPLESRIANVEVEAGPIVSGLSFEVDREESPEKAGDFGRRVIPSSHHHGCDPLYSCGRLPMARFAERLSAVHDRSALQSSARRRGSFLQAFARFLGVEEGKTRGGGRFVIAGLVVPAISNRKA